MLKQCAKCNNDFITYPSKIKLGRGKYCSRECAMIFTNKALVENGKKSRFKKGQMPHQFKGFRFAQSRKDSKKYKLIYKPDHPNATKSGHIREHRLVVEEFLGRRLKQSEIVHHLDGNTLNNHISNLQLINKRDHDRMNTPLNIHRRWRERGDKCRTSS